MATENVSKNSLFTFPLKKKKKSRYLDCKIEMNFSLFTSDIINYVKKKQ